MFTKMEQKGNKKHDGRHCDLCGCSSPAVRCDKCNSQIFCLSCDDMYHRHPKRRFHLRKAVDPTPTPMARPVLPMKVSNMSIAPGDPSKMPLPPPRKKKSGKSIFDSFRRGSPAADTSPNLPKKEYSWSDRFGNIKKFMSQRPLPPVPDNDTENFPPETVGPPKNDFSFIHSKGEDEEKPPALPQRNQQRSPEPLTYQNQKPSNGDVLGPPAHENGFTMADMSRNMHSGLPFNQWPDNFQQGGMNQHFQQPMASPGSNVEAFGTLRRQSQPLSSSQSPSNIPGEKLGGMHQSSSATDLHALSTMPQASGMPSYPHYPYNPHLPPQYQAPYPMYPQYPGYPQYFGNSWANLANPHQTTMDGEFSDQSGTSPTRHPHSRNATYKEKKAKRSQSVVIDRMGYPGQYYPYGPFPPGYLPPPWITGHHPKEAPPSPSVSMRSLSRLSQPHRRKKATDEDDDEDFSSSPLSRPKSSSSEVSKLPRRVRRPSCPSSSSEEEVVKERRHPKASPAMERRQLKQEMLKRRSSSPRPPSAAKESPNVGRRFSGDNKKTTRTQQLKAAHDEQSENSGNESTKMKNKPKNNVIKKLEIPTENKGGDVHEQEDAVWTPTERWYCEHCTFLNNPGERICQVCCKTVAKSQQMSDQQQNISADNAQSNTEQPEVAPSNEKQDIALLNSALDEAEKEINRSLDELLKIQDEPDDVKPEPNPQQIEQQALSHKTRHAGIQNNLVQSEDFKTAPNTPQSTNGISTQTMNGNVQSQSPAKNVSVSTLEGSREANAADVLKGENKAAASTSPMESNSHTLKDSFCQTYQDVVLPEFPSDKAVVNQNAAAKEYPRPSDRASNLQSPSPYNAYNLDRGTGGIFGLHRAHSRASLFGGRLNDTSPATLEYGGMGFMPSLYRSLSRSSLLGDNDGWTSEYPSGHKPDFYLSMEELVERRRQETMRAQGLELVRMIREAEQQGFTADDIQVALNNCGKQNPVNWLQDNWKTMIHTVVTLATNFGKDKRENDVGGISENEARDALRLHKGNIWAAVTECVEGRQRKFLELSARGNFTFAEIVDALTSSEGNVEIAYSELTKTSLKPFLMRIWGSGEGAQNLDAATGPDVRNYNDDEDESVYLSESKFSKALENDKNASDQDLWEDEDYVDDDEEWEVDAEREWEFHAEREKESENDNAEIDIGTENNDHVLVDNKDTNSNKNEPAEKSGTLSNILTPESDKSEYCDAFGSGLGERYLSSSSIDEIYLLGVEENEEGEDFRDSDVAVPCTKSKGTGFLKKLADLRKIGLSEATNVDLVNVKDFVNVDEPPEKFEDTISNSPYNLEEEDKSESKTFNPLDMSKPKFASIKETLPNNASHKRSSPSLSERRTIIVHGRIARETILSDSSDQSVMLKSYDPVFLDDHFSSCLNESQNRTPDIVKQKNEEEIANSTSRIVDKDTKKFSDTSKIEYSDTDLNSHIPVPSTSSDAFEKSTVIENQEITTEENYCVKESLKENTKFQDSITVASTIMEVKANKDAVKLNATNVSSETDRSSLNTEIHISSSSPVKSPVKNIKKMKHKKSNSADEKVISNYEDTIMKNLQKESSRTIEDEVASSVNVSVIPKVQVASTEIPTFNSGSDVNVNEIGGSIISENFEKSSINASEIVNVAAIVTSVVSNIVAPDDYDILNSAILNESTVLNSATLNNSVDVAEHAVLNNASISDDVIHNTSVVAKHIIVDSSDVSIPADTNSSDVPTLSNTSNNGTSNSSTVNCSNDKDATTANSSNITTVSTLTSSDITNASTLNSSDITDVFTLNNSDISNITSSNNSDIVSTVISGGSNVKDEFSLEASKIENTAMLNNSDVLNSAMPEVVLANEIEETRSSEIYAVENNLMVDDNGNAAKLSFTIGEEPQVDVLSSENVTPQSNTLGTGNESSILNDNHKLEIQENVDNKIVESKHHVVEEKEKAIAQNEIVPLLSAQHSANDTTDKDGLAKSTLKSADNSTTKKKTKTVKKSKKAAELENQSSSKIVESPLRETSKELDATSTKQLTLVNKEDAKSVETSEVLKSTDIDDKPTEVNQVISQSSSSTELFAKSEVSNVSEEVNASTVSNVLTGSDIQSLSDFGGERSSSKSLSNSNVVAVEAIKADFEEKLSDSKTKSTVGDTAIITEAEKTASSSSSPLQASGAEIAQLESLLESASDQKLSENSSQPEQTTNEQIMVQNSTSVRDLEQANSVPQNSVSEIKEMTDASTSKTVQEPLSEVQQAVNKSTVASQELETSSDKTVQSTSQKEDTGSIRSDTSFSSNSAASRSAFTSQISVSTDGEADSSKADELSISSGNRSRNDGSDDEMSDGSFMGRPMSPIRPVGNLRRMSFNTRKEAIFQERNKISVVNTSSESKPWFLPKKVDTFKPSMPKRTIKQQLEFERRVRKLVSDRKCRTYRKAEIIVQLLDLNFDEPEAIEAANECSTFEQAVSFLQQECQLCAGNYPVKEIVSMVHCSHKACRECIKAYFTIQIRDRTIMELLCPFCNEPDISDEDVAQDYFNHLDMLLKKLVEDDIHELFQRKLRDRVLMKDPNFRWCTQCSSGFIADPYLKKLMCPDCKAIMCASCRRLWERNHEGVSCEVFAAIKDATDPESQTASLERLLAENGIACPNCHFKYTLAKGGCMHFKCIQCQHDFCSGCSRSFKMGQKCGVSEFCAKLGLHAHHPRNCLFYLRDKDPEDLQKLLDMNDIPYDKEPPDDFGARSLCQVMEQKETSYGMVDAVCGKDVQAGYAGLCRIHYVEYLGQLVNKHKIDPIQIFDNDDLELVLRRASIRLPPKKYRESPAGYREKLVQVIEDRLPLDAVEGS